MYSGFSDPVCATTPPAPIIPAPSATAVTPHGSYEVQITWTDNSPDEEGFFIERAPAMTGPWSSVNTAPANATSVSQFSSPEDFGCFRVVAFIAARRSLPSAADCTATPVWPTGLSGTGTAEHNISLHWTDNSGVEDGYEVNRYNAGAGWTVVATLPANATTYVDNGVTVDVRYTYQVRALKDGGYGNYSNAVTALAPTTKPAAPSEASAYFYFDEWSWEYYFVISWTPGSANEEGFQIKIPDGAGGWTTYATAEAGAWSWWEYYNYESPQSGCYQIVAFNALGESSPAEACVTP
jgi:hypothetical protein